MPNPRWVISMGSCAVRRPSGPSSLHLLLHLHANLHPLPPIIKLADDTITMCVSPPPLVTVRWNSNNPKSLALCFTSFFYSHMRRCSRTPSSEGVTGSSPSTSTCPAVRPLPKPFCLVRPFPFALCLRTVRETSSDTNDLHCSHKTLRHAPTTAKDEEESTGRSVVSQVDDSHISDVQKVRRKAADPCPPPFFSHSSHILPSHLHLPSYLFNAHIMPP